MDLPGEVKAAFSQTPYPGDEALTACGCDDCRWEVRRFQGKRWSRLTWDDVGQDGNLCLLTPEAFHYFLPGLILLAIQESGGESGLLDRIINRLVVSDRERNSETVRKTTGRIIGRLSTRQRQILIELMNQAADSVPHVSEIWRSAIKNLMDGDVTPYSQDTVERQVQEQCRSILERSDPLG